MLHSYYSAVALVPDVLEYIFIVYLAGSGLVAPGNVAYLEVCYFVPSFVYIGNEAAFRYLLVVEVVENFAVLAANSLAKRVGLRNPLQPKAWVVLYVERLEYDSRAVVFLQDFANAL